MQCVKCHMPERRTEDATHIVMTDHRIERRPPKHDLQQPLQESPGSEDDTYLGEVRLLYPPEPSADPDAALYLAVAQVKEAANLKDGVLSLSALLRRRPDARAEFYYELAGAFRKMGDLPQALAAYEEARRRNPNFVPGMRNFADTLAAAGRIPRAIDLLKAAVDSAPGDAKSWNMLGGFYAQIQRPREAAQALRRAITEDPDLPEIYTNLGVALSEQGDRGGAETALRRAILLAPDLAVAHLNLGALLATEKRIDEARAELEIASHGRRPKRATPPFASWKRCLSSPGGCAFVCWHKKCLLNYEGGKLRASGEISGKRTEQFIRDYGGCGRFSARYRWGNWLNGGRHRQRGGPRRVRRQEIHRRNQKAD